MTANVYYTVDEVAANAATIIRGSTREDRHIYRQWVWNGERELGYSEMQVGSDCILVEDLAARKPDNYRKLKDIALLDCNGNEYRAKMRGYFQRNHEDLLATEIRSIDIYENDNYFVLGSNGSIITHVKIDYYGMPLDADGNPKIPEHHMLPLMFFVKFMDALVRGENQSEISEAERRWKMEAAKCRGKNKMPSQPQAREIMEQWMTMIPQRLNQNEY
jgi:hypothetical protein